MARATLHAPQGSQTARATLARSTQGLARWRALYAHARTFLYP